MEAVAVINLARRARRLGTTPDDLLTWGDACMVHAAVQVAEYDDALAAGKSRLESGRGD